MINISILNFFNINAHSIDPDAIDINFILIILCIIDALIGIVNSVWEGFDVCNLPSTKLMLTIDLINEASNIYRVLECFSTTSSSAHGWAICIQRIICVVIVLAVVVASNRSLIRCLTNCSLSTSVVSCLWSEFNISCDGSETRIVRNNHIAIDCIVHRVIDSVDFAVLDWAIGILVMPCVWIVAWLVKHYSWSCRYTWFVQEVFGTWLIVVLLNHRARCTTSSSRL